MSGDLEGRPVKLTDGRWAVMVDGLPAVGEKVTVTTLEGKRWEATITEVHSTDPTTGEVLCLTARGPALPDATPEQLAERQARSEVWMHRHREAAKGKGCAGSVAALVALVIAAVVGLAGGAE